MGYVLHIFFIGLGTRRKNDRLYTALYDKMDIRLFSISFRIKACEVLLDVILFKNTYLKQI